MADALVTYLHRIGLVAEMLLPIPQRSDDAAANEDALSSGQLQQQPQQQQQQPTSAISSTKYLSLPSVTKFRSAANGIPVYTNPVIESSSVGGSSDLGFVPVASSSVANYPPSVEPLYPHSPEATSWSTAEPRSRTFLIGDAIVNTHPNAVTTVTVRNRSNDVGTKSSHQSRNITQVSHVSSKQNSPPNTRQTIAQCSTNPYPLSHGISHVTRQNNGIPATAYPVAPVHVDQNSPFPAQAAAMNNSPNFKDTTDHIHTNDRSCFVDVGCLPFESSGVSGSDLACDNSLVISLQQNLSDILHLNEKTFDQSQLNRSNQSTMVDQAHSFDDHCSRHMPNNNNNNLHLPADDSKRKEAELPAVSLSSSKLSPAADSSPLLSQSSSMAFQVQPPLIKSSLKKEALPNGVRKAVTFCTSDLVHVEEYTISPATPPHDLFLPLENISDDKDSVLFGADSAELWPPGTQENCDGSWFDSSTDAEPYLVNFPSPDDDTRDCAPLSFANDVFGRTTIFLTSGTFRPGESGKLNGKTVGDLSGSREHGRTLSTGTLGGLRSHRTLVKVNFIQGLLDINHNPGQTTEAESKAAQDNRSSIVSTLSYSGGIFHENLKNPSIKAFPNEERAAEKRVDQKLFYKLSRHKYKLIAVILGVFVLLSLAIGLGVGLR